MKQFRILHDLDLNAPEKVVRVFWDVHTTQKSPFQKESKCTDLHTLSWLQGQDGACIHLSVKINKGSVSGFGGLHSVKA